MLEIAFSRQKNISCMAKRPQSFFWLRAQAGSIKEGRTDKNSNRGRDPRKAVPFLKQAAILGDLSLTRWTFPASTRTRRCRSTKRLSCRRWPSTTWLRPQRNCGDNTGVLHLLLCSCSLMKKMCFADWLPVVTRYFRFLGHFEVKYLSCH